MNHVWIVDKEAPLHLLEIACATAYAEYAVEASGIQSKDVFLKPIATARPQNAASRRRHAVSAAQARRDAGIHPYIPLRFGAAKGISGMSGR
jgi:two-component SAPR family response regulator